MEKEIKKCRIAKILKIGSLVFLAFGIIGSMVMAEESEIVLTEKKSRWYEEEEDSFETVTKLNPSTFFGIVMDVTATSGLVYGVGELIQLQSDNNEMIRVIVSKREDEDIENEKTD